MRLRLRYDMPRLHISQLVAGVMWSLFFKALAFMAHSMELQPLNSFFGSINSIGTRYPSSKGCDTSPFIIQSW